MLDKSSKDLFYLDFNKLLLLDWTESMEISKEYWMSGRNWLGGGHQLVLLKQEPEGAYWLSF